MPLMIGWALTKMIAWRKPPIYVEGFMLHAQTWREALDMRLVDRILVDEASWPAARISACVFVLKDGSRRRLPIVFLQESAYGVAVALNELFAVPIEQAKANAPLS